MHPPVEDCLRRLPRKIKVGAYDWKVVFGEGNEKHGEADFETSTITLWPETLTSPNHCVGIFLHECLHVIYDNENLIHAIEGSHEEVEEELVVGFEHGLVSLFRDNPKLMTWIKKGLK